MPQPILNQALSLTKHAEQCGADAVSATPLLFFKYTEDDVYNYYKALANQVHIPLMIYYNPAAGFAVNAKFAARMFEIDNITANFMLDIIRGVYDNFTSGNIKKAQGYDVGNATFPMKRYTEEQKRLWSKK